MGQTFRGLPARFLGEMWTIGEELRPLGHYAAVFAEFRRSEEIDLMAEVECAGPRAARHFDGKLVGAGAIVFGRLSAGVGTIGCVDARGADWAFVRSVTEFHFVV